ncbi:hypothetical protein [Metabacillus sp. RGM 3146]
MKWLRGPKMAIVWTVLRLWLGYQWEFPLSGDLQKKCNRFAIIMRYAII